MTTIIAVTADPVVLKRLEALGRSMGATVLPVERIADIFPDEAPLALVVDLDVRDPSESVAPLKARWPDAHISGFLSSPDRAQWEAAEAAGYDLVANRGAIGLRLKTVLPGWVGAASMRRVRLLDVAETAGRLGLVGRFADTPVGPVAVYQVGNHLYAVADVCPHAGATLSEGECAAGVVTCPRHGSQFDVRTGERLRGPADEPIASHSLSVEAGSVFLVVP